MEPRREEGGSWRVKCEGGLDVGNGPDSASARPGCMSCAHQPRRPEQVIAAEVVITDVQQRMKRQRGDTTFVIGMNDDDPLRRQAGGMCVVSPGDVVMRPSCAQVWRDQTQARGGLAVVGQTRRSC